MAYNLEWHVYYSNVVGFTEITQYVTDLVVDVSCPIGIAGRAQATININNDTGAFTPGGSGTFANVDWFSYALEIQAVADGVTVSTFSGIIQDFDIRQISIKQSIVTIKALDFISVGGRSKSDPPTASTLIGTADAMIAEFFNSNGTYFSNPDTPTLGSTTNKQSAVAVQFDTETAFNTTVTSSQLSTGRIGDWINTNVLTTGPMTIWPIVSTIYLDQWIWQYVGVDKTLNRDTYIKEFVLVDKSSTIASGEIPITEITVGYTVDTLTNITTVQDADQTFTSVTATNTTSTQKYGPRARSYTATAAYTQQTVTDAANFWTNRYGTVRYIPLDVTLTYSTLKAYAVDNGTAEGNFLSLLNSLYNVWNRIKLTYKGPGMSSASTTYMIADGIRIMATPADTRIDLRLQSGIDNQSFELNSSTFGILNTNRLG